MSYPYHSMIIGIVMMALLTVFVNQFTSRPEDSCQNNSNGFQKCIDMMNDMRQLMIVAWPIYMGGMIGFSLYIRKISKNKEVK